MKDITVWVPDKERRMLVSATIEGIRIEFPKLQLSGLLQQSRTPPQVKVTKDDYFARKLAESARADKVVRDTMLEYQEDKFILYGLRVQKSLDNALGKMLDELNE